MYMHVYVAEGPHFCEDYRGFFFSLLVNISVQYQQVATAELSSQH